MFVLPLLPIILWVISLGMFFVEKVPAITSQADLFGWELAYAFWWIQVPVTVILMTIPFSFGFAAFSTVRRMDSEMFAQTEGFSRKTALLRRNLSVSLLVIGFYLVGQLFLNVAFPSIVSAIYSSLNSTDLGGFILKAVIINFAVFITLQLIFPIALLPFVAVAKRLSPQFTPGVLSIYRRFVRGFYPFLNWTIT